MSDSNPTPATARRRGAERRDAILEATIKVIGERGIDGVTHRNVAQVANIPLASTTYWFASKDELLEQAFRYAAAQDIATLQTRLAQARTLNEPIAAISAVLLLQDDESQTIGRPRAIAAYALWLEAARRPSLRRTARKWTDAYVAAISDLFASAGSAEPDDAKILIAAVDGLVLDQLAQHTEADLRPTVERMATALLRTQ